MVIVAVAGTFAVIHDGHRALFEKAFDIGDKVLVGITSDEMTASAGKKTLSLYLRQKALEEYLKTFDRPFEIMVIEDAYGPRDKMDDVDILVVSPETESNGRKVADERTSRGVKPLILEVVPIVETDAGGKISSSDILVGKYSRSGNTQALDIVVGSMNHVKVEAVRNVMERIFGDVRVSGIDVPSEVSEQPKEGATRDGAVNRARNALGDHDIAVGIEAGVFERIDGLFDFQYCAVLDRDGRLTVGTGPGFQYPPQVASLVRAGLTVGDAMKRVFGETDIGKKQGAVGFLSKGLLDRQKLTEQAVTAAMIPRLDPSYLV